ncbi:MAG TPA: aminotransferase class I/II-fold pyridoxal phosphate-dependent enzyme [Phycisphaerales bacterium]|nr:aminotransferase class I/II-fold pyridoxal phosphate-dependent enzyme [Phycisphaerales bacterium]
MPMGNIDVHVEPWVEISPEKYRLDCLPEVRRFQGRFEKAQNAGIEQPYFRLRTEDPDKVNLNSYNYLGLNGHPEVLQAAKDAVDKYGTSASASRLVGGELPLHRQLEQELADFLGTEDAMVLVSGHATNVTLISYLLGPADLVIHDAFAHDSAVRGALASRAKRCQFSHNDLSSLEEILKRERHNYRRTMVLVEGLYSMDGDFPNLPELERLQEKYNFMLMVDEAHSMGVLGETGRGIAEQFKMRRSEQIIWMGTLSKSLASCGGYLAGSRDFIQFLRHSLPGFVYSVGMTPANAAGALASLRILKREPQRVAKLRTVSNTMGRLLKEANLSTGTAQGIAIFPVFFPEPHQVMQISQALSQRGIEASGIIFPAVPRSASRLRFFLSSLHTEEQLKRAVDTLQELAEG